MSSNPIVLVASDLSARCDRPVDRAFLLAEQLGGSVLLAHVAGDRPLSREREEQVRSFIGADLADRAEHVQVEVAHGSVPSTLARLASDREAKVIVTGVGRMNDLRDYFLGTAVDYLVRQAPVPVLVVKQRPLRPYHRLVVATDFSACSLKAIEIAARMFPQAELRVVHSWHPAFEGFLDARKTGAFIKEQASEEMERFVAQLPADVLSRIDTRLEEGELTAAVQRCLHEWPGDLLVVGSHGRSGFAHATIGSRAAELLATEPVDILVVR